MAAVLAAVRAREAKRGVRAIIRDSDACKFADERAFHSLDQDWRHVPYFAPLILARSRLINTVVDELLRLDSSVSQIVSLGAGYSTDLDRLERKWRNRLRTFECDREHLVSRKRNLIGRTYLPRLLAVDLSREAAKLPRVLARSGFRQSARSLFVMEGLLYYLAPRHVTELFKIIAALCEKRGGVVVFDIYTVQSRGITKGVTRTLSNAGISARMERPSTWFRRLEGAGFVPRGFANAAWADSSKSLAAFSLRISTCLFVADYGSAEASSGSR